LQQVSRKSTSMIVLAHRRDPFPHLSRAALARLRMLEWHINHGGNVSRTSRHFGVSRPTFYRWQARYNPRHLAQLEGRSARPQRLRQATWSSELVAAVHQLREQYPRWGKDKLVVLLRRAGHRVSTSMVGRILRSLRDRNLLSAPVRWISARRRRRWLRHHAVRKPKDYVPRRPGDLVQMDTLDVRLGPDMDFKHFTARDVVTRWDVLTVGRTATAYAATSALDAVQARMPFPVRAIQVDGGSEFMAEFEQACADRGIRLFVLPPHSPKLNGRVERGHRTHTEEFYECTDAEPTVAAQSAALLDWEHVYNTIRPHQALGQLTPLEFLSTHFTKEDL
jgi:transposase InsO family protein